MNGQRDLLVTLADRSYLDQAKQLFASAYFQGGWNGDYMLLAHDIADSDLAWFHRKGILIKHCRPLYEGRPGGMSNVLTSKFYLFTEEFKQWRTIIYSDADASIRSSLDGLRGLKGFHAVPDISRYLKVQVVNRDSIEKRKIDPNQCERLVRELRGCYDLNEQPFCAGFFVFSPASLEQAVSLGLRQMLDRYAVVSEYGDQLAFNLYFYRRWQRLPLPYNIQVVGERNAWHLPPEDVAGIIFHFISADKPWIVKNYYYHEWLKNFNRADQIDLQRIPQGRPWSRRMIVECDRLLENMRRRNRFYLWLDGYAGKCGKVIARKNDGLYHRLVRWKRQLLLDDLLHIGVYLNKAPRLLKDLNDGKGN